jgi:hypothetical protein
MHAVLVEKILRVQPDVKKLYLLVRAPDDAAAQQRVLHEVCAALCYKSILRLHACISRNETKSAEYHACMSMMHG